MGRLARFDRVVMLAETVRQQFSTCLAQCRDIGRTDHAPRLAVIPHGLDTRVFHPLGDRPAVRVTIAGLRDLPNDTFVVLKADRNQPRKRIDLKLGGFARFACDKPPGVTLSLHMGEAHHGTGLRALIQELGINERVVLTSTEAGGHPRIDDRALNRLYDACDVGLNTASGEGCGMTSFEHAATGAAQIVPGSWVCGEIWQGSAELLDSDRDQSDDARFTRQVAVTVEGVAAALQRLHADVPYRARTAARGAALAAEPRCQWSTIAASRDSLLRELRAVNGRLPGQVDSDPVWLSNPLVPGDCRCAQDLGKGCI